MMIQEVPFGSRLYDLTLRFRDEQLRRPLGLALSAAELAGEEQQIHLAALDPGPEQTTILGTLVLQPLSATAIKLRQMAIAPERRGQGLGRRLVGFAEDLAAERGFRDIEMSARVGARGFYERLGYHATGEAFLSVSIPHIRMTRRI